MTYSSNPHSLLHRQIKKSISDSFQIPKEIEILLDLVNDAYFHYDSDRALLERSLELSSAELGELNQRLSKDIADQKILLVKLREAATELEKKDSSSVPDPGQREESLIILADRIRNEIQKRKVAEANLIALLDNTTDSIWSINSSLELLTFNSSFYNRIAKQFQVHIYTGMNIEEIFGIGSTEMKVWKAYFVRPLSGDRIIHDRKISISDRTVDFEISLNPIVSEGKIVGITIFERDISDRKRTEAEMIKAKNLAESANSAKSDFLTTMSHELRTPLNAIIGYSELIQENLIDNSIDTISADTDKIRAAGRHLLALINEILDLSKIEAGKMDIELSKIEIEATIFDLKAIFGNLIERQGNQLVMDLKTSVKTIVSDPNKLKQILINLLGNAGKFTKRGKISLTISDEERDQKQGIRFDVADSGIGIAADKIALLFQPFSQLDTSPARKYGGTGLGLAVTKRLCQLLHGQISCSSEYGKGSVFTVWLPLEFPLTQPNLTTNS